jgi:hypothetical protein
MFLLRNRQADKETQLSIAALPFFFYALGETGIAIKTTARRCCRAWGVSKSCVLIAADRIIDFPSKLA